MLTGQVVYQVITNDKYELPLFQADTVREIAEALGRPRESIDRMIRENMASLDKKYRVIKIELDDEEN